MNTSPTQIRKILETRDARFAILRSATERARADHARLFAAKARADELRSLIDGAALASARERYAEDLRHVEQTVAILTSELEASRDAEARAKDEWQAAARLASRVENFCSANGVRLPEAAPILGPDISGHIHGEVRA